MARLYGAVYALWMARDDSHNAAWRAAGFDGPTFDLLSRVWSGEATTVPALIEAMRDFQRPEDVTRGIASLVAAGYISQHGDTLRLTVAGRSARTAIEAETDRVYFAPWPTPTGDADHWLRMTLGSIAAHMSR